MNNTMFKQVVLTLNIVFQKVNIQFNIILPFIPRFQNAFLISSLPSYIFFFFYWLYNTLWVLAFPLIFFHSALSSHLPSYILHTNFFSSRHACYMDCSSSSTSLCYHYCLSTPRLLVLIFKNTFYHTGASDF